MSVIHKLDISLAYSKSPFVNEEARLKENAPRKGNIVAYAGEVHIAMCSRHRMEMMERHS